MTESQGDRPAHEEQEGDAGLGAAPQGASAEGRPDVEQDPEDERADAGSDAAAGQSEREDAGHA